MRLWITNSKSSKQTLLSLTSCVTSFPSKYFTRTQFGKAKYVLFMEENGYICQHKMRNMIPLVPSKHNPSLPYNSFLSKLYNSNFLCLYIELILLFSGKHKKPDMIYLLILDKIWKDSRYILGHS